MWGKMDLPSGHMAMLLGKIVIKPGILSRRFGCHIWTTFEHNPTFWRLKKGEIYPVQTGLHGQQPCILKGKGSCKQMDRAESGWKIRAELPIQFVPMVHWKVHLSMANFHWNNFKVTTKKDRTESFGFAIVLVLPTIRLENGQGEPAMQAKIIGECQRPNTWEWTHHTNMECQMAWKPAQHRLLYSPHDLKSCFPSSMGRK